MYSVFIFLMYCIILLHYNIKCVIIVLFAGCSVIVGRHDILPCAAPFKSLQGVAVPFSFFSFKWHCKLLIITLLIKCGVGMITIYLKFFFPYFGSFIETVFTNIALFIVFLVFAVWYSSLTFLGVNIFSSELNMG